MMKHYTIQYNSATTIQYNFHTTAVLVAKSSILVKGNPSSNMPLGSGKSVVS